MLRRVILGAAFAYASGAWAQAAAPSDGLASTGEYIVGFVQYVHWPAEDAAKTWQVCVGSPLGDRTAYYAGRTARGKAFSVRAVAASDALADCHILDLTNTSEGDAKAFLARARPLAILTVGEGERFCTTGGIACLRSHPDGGFEINLSAVQRARLMVNAQLLMLGRRRETAGDGPTPGGRL